MSDVSCHPANGIQDDEMAEVLAKELDALSDDTVHVLDCDDAVDAEVISLENCAVKSSSRQAALKEKEWVLFDLCFGIPLFDPQLNADVCKRIASFQLFSEERYTWSIGVVV